MVTQGIKGDIFRGRRTKLEVVAVIGKGDTSDFLSENLGDETTDVVTPVEPEPSVAARPVVAAVVPEAVPLPPAVEPAGSVDVDEPIPFRLRRR
jgi:hypothetical protein